MAEQDSEKTEQATPKRQQEAREKGQVARSHEIASVAVLMAGTTVLYFLFPRIYSNLLDLTSNIFSTSWNIELSEANIHPFWVGVLKKVFFTMLPFLLIVALTGVASNILQFGFIFTTQALEFKLSRISPLAGVKRIISIRSLAELVKAILKIIIVGYAAYLLISREFYNFPLLVDADIAYILSYTGRLTLRLIIWTGAVLAVLAGIDFGFQKWEHVKSLRMTRQEVKEEFKQQEGDPIIKARIRSLQREMAKKRMMADVPKADVVITNPTHLAVALSYKHEKMSAPRVIAKGAGIIAEKIKEIAAGHGIAIVENKPVAQSLYRLVKVGEDIPANLYRAVAEILAYVYKLKRKV